MNKLLIDSGTKTAFSYDNIFYQQWNGVSLGSSVVPVPANIILTDFEKLVATLLMESRISF